MVPLVFTKGTYQKCLSDASEQVGSVGRGKLGTGAKESLWWSEAPNLNSGYVRPSRQSLRVE